MIVQLLPLPSSAVYLISPADAAVWRRVYFAVPSWLPLTIHPRSTAWAAVIWCLTVATFVSARRLLTSGGIRVVIRGVSAIAIAVSGIGIAQDATAHGLMYWTRAPLQEGAPPFGPFVDRNSFATWVLLAAPLCAGYLIAHTVAHHRHQHALVRWTVRLRAALDARAIWLTAAVILMLIALATTLSRSGLSSLVAVVMLGGYLKSRRRAGAGGWPGWVTTACAATIVFAVARIDPLVLGRRFAAAPTSAADRLVIWRETLPIVRDFWLTGTGAGTYETAMLVYQRSSPGVRFNQAHNHYLQVVAEGGLLLTVPLLIAAWTYGRSAASRVAADQTGMYWIRAGALSGLIGVAAQSLWETGLTVPANAFLAAITAAIAIHPLEMRTNTQA
jgi:hypothetical protein